MQLAVNDHVQVQNYVTNEHSQMRVIDVFGYHGQFIVYGELAARSVWIPNRAEGKATRIHKPARPSCFVVLPDSSDAEVSQFVDAVRGLPLRVKKGKDYLKVVNTPSLEGWWDGSLEKDRLIEHCQQVVDLWETWSKLGRRLPFWFLELQRAASSVTS